MKTCMEKYGVNNPSKDPKIKKKIRDVWMKKYGVDHPMKVREIVEKTLQSGEAFEGREKAEKLLDEMR